MLKVRRSEERGGADHGWLKTRHTFSFGGYFDPEQMGFRSLRVINEDYIQSGEGFGMHPHKNMEIISFVKSGGLVHRDSMGNESTLRGGEFQRMTAGRGVTHSEFSEAGNEDTHLLQIWIIPEVQGLAPSYEELRPSGRSGLTVVASPDQRDGSMKIHQDVVLSHGIFSAGEKVDYALKSGRAAYLQVVEGKLSLNGVELTAGDGAQLEAEEQLEIVASSEAEFLLFDLR